MNDRMMCRVKFCPRLDTGPDGPSSGRWNGSRSTEFVSCSASPRTVTAVIGPDAVSTSLRSAMTMRRRYRGPVPGDQPPGRPYGARMTSPARRLGADPEDLQRLAASFDRAARSLADSVARADRALDRAAWHGPAAAAFSRRWASDRAVVRAAAQRCTAAARELRQQLEQQRTAAASGRTSGGPGRTAPPPLSRSESLVRLGGFVDVGPLEGRAAVLARVEELDAARSRVTVSDLVGVAGVAAVGATVEAGCQGSTATPFRPLRAEADVAAGLEVEHRTVWEVPDDDVHGLLAAEGAQRVAAGLGPGLGPLATAVARRLGPEPVGHEALLRAVVSAGAVSPRPGPVGPALSAHAVASVAVGLATGPRGRHTLVVEAGDDAAVRLQSGFLSALGLDPAHRGTSTFTRLELPRPSGDARPVRLEVRSTSSSGTVDRVVVHARLSADAAVQAAADRARADLAAGRAPSRSTLDALLAGVRGTATDPVVQVDRLEASSKGCAARSVGGAGVRLGGGAGVQVVNLRPGR